MQSSFALWTPRSLIWTLAIYHGQNPVFHWKLLQDLTVNNSHNYRLLLLRDYGHIHGTKMTILFWFLIKHTMYFSCNINMQHYSLLFTVYCLSFVKNNTHQKTSGTFLFTSNFFLSTQWSLLHRHPLHVYHSLHIKSTF